MYTAIRRYKVQQPGDVAVFARRVTEGFAPLISQAPGFIAWHLMRLEDEVLTSFSVFEHQAQAHASTLLAVGWVKENLADLRLEPASVTGGEVPVYAVREGHAEETRQAEAQQ